MTPPPLGGPLDAPFPLRSVVYVILITAVIVAIVTAVAIRADHNAEDRAAAESKWGTGFALGEDGRPAVGARIRVCTKESKLVKPCFPLASIYADHERRIPIANPMIADPNGNFGFYAVPGLYYIEVEQ